MPQDVEAYLRSLHTSDRVRAAAWDAVHAADDAEAEARLRAILPLSNEVKAALWDARAGTAPAPVAAAEPPASEPGAVSRFVSNAAERLNPVTMARGVYQAVRHPIETAGSLVQAQGEQFRKAASDARQGRYVEMLGHGTAGALPILGPMAAEIGEQAGSGDLAGAAGAALGSVVPLGAAAPIGRAARRAAGPLKASAEQRVVQALGPTKERFKAIAEKRAPEILARGLGGSREALQAQAAAQVKQVGQQIDDVITAHGGKTINPTPIVEALEEAKGAFQTQRRMTPLEAIQSGKEQAPGARMVGDTVEVPIVHEPRAVKQLSELQNVITDLGPEARVDQLVAIRRTWDKVVADAGGFGHRAPGALGQPLNDVSEAAAKREATRAIRRLLDQEVPSLSAVNKEFAFWKDLDSVLTQTLKRTKPQSSGLGRVMREGAGAVAGSVVGSTAGPMGAGAGAFVGGALAKAAHSVFTSPRWKLVSARARTQLADAIVSGNPERISTALGRAQAMTGGGTMLPAMAAEDDTTPAPARAQRSPRTESLTRR